MSYRPRITVAKGDGIGPEITDATLRIIRAAKTPLDYDFVDIGEKLYLRGVLSGISPNDWQIIRENKVLLKGPITTPQGGGYKSLNVTIRKAIGLFANVRQCKSYTPFVPSAYPGLNMIIIRENEEDLYAGIEHQQTQEVTQVLKLITRPGSESIIRYAFEYAKAYGRKKVTCMTKDNIMKVTDGLFHKIFNQVASEYPEIESNHQIIDIGAARVAAQPESLDVIVTLNLYGDILSDIAAQVAGSVGLAGSANIGRDGAMFEAIHGSAPDIAGKGIANPSGLIVAATQMLVHIGLGEYAEKIKNAWLCTLEDGIHPADIYKLGLSKKLVGTEEFADAVIERLDKKPRYLEPVSYKATKINFTLKPVVKQNKELVGVDVFLDWDKENRDPNFLGNHLEQTSELGFKLKIITNRGVKVYPDGFPETFCTDHWRCRFISQKPTTSFEEILLLLKSINQMGFEVIKTEHLYNYDGERGYSLGQGE